ncbi:MAG TPA: Gp138 family membrane-puncturing spike protein [Polyangia bacterium]|nr:Gp138 family membrane-puncturing spike protein [Polyangia bacterium]
MPVYFPAGGGFVLTLPVAQGDECLVVFSERAIDNWFAHGGIQGPSEFRLHDYSDGFAFVGFASKPNAIPVVATDAVELRTRDGTTVFRLEAGTAYVGGKVGAESALKAETYRQRQSGMHTEMLAALQVVNTTAQAIGPGDLASLAPTVSALILSLKAFLPMWIASLNEFEYYAPTYLAQKAKVF